MNCESQIIPSLKESLLDDNTRNILSDFAEIGIDSVVNDGLLKDIPFVGTVMSLGKFAANLYDRNLLKQTLIFIKTFNRETIDPSHYNEYKNKINKNSKTIEAELERVLIILNTNIDNIKSQILAKFFAAYIDKKINWDRFCELSDVISRLFVSDIQLLLKVYKNPLKITKKISYRIERLNALGVLRKAHISRRIDGGEWGQKDKKQRTEINDEWHAKITGLGNDFCINGLYPLE